MKIEVCCPDCRHACLVDENVRAGELLCPKCLTRIPLGRKAAPTPAPEPEPDPERPAVCPRCNLHFTIGTAPAVVDSERRRTVLIVEDLEYFRELARSALDARYDVETASSAQEARTVLARGGVDLLVLDLTLDGGEEEGRSLLRDLMPKPCPILIYTAKDESEMYGDSWGELQNLGADDIVIKGMNVGESLVRKVSTLLGLKIDD